MTKNDYKKYMDFLESHISQYVATDIDTRAPYMTDELFSEIDTIFHKKMTTKEQERYFKSHFTDKYMELTNGMDSSKIKELYDISSNIFHNRCDVLKKYGKTNELDKQIELIYLASAFIEGENIDISIKEKAFTLISNISKEEAGYKRPLLINILKDSNVSNNFLEIISKQELDVLENIFTYPTPSMVSIKNRPEYAKDIPMAVKRNLAFFLIKNGFHNRLLNKMAYHLNDISARIMIDATNEDEKAVAAFLSNKNVEESVRDKHFDTYGFDPMSLNIANITPHMAQELTKQAWESLYDIEGVSYEVKRNSTIMILNLLRNKKMPESYQIDIANRIALESTRSHGNELEKTASLFMTSPTALTVLLKLKNSNKDNIFLNENCPQELYEKQINSIIKKSERTIRKNGASSIKYKQDIYGITENHAVDANVMKAVFFMDINSAPHLRNIVKHFISTRDLTEDALKLFIKPTIEINGNEYKVPQTEQLYARCALKALEDKTIDKKIITNMLFAILNADKFSETVTKNKILQFMNDTGKDFSKYVKIIEDCMDKIEDNEWLKNNMKLFKNIASEISEIEIKDFETKQNVIALVEETKQIPSMMAKRLDLIMQNEQLMKDYIDGQNRENTRSLRLGKNIEFYEFKTDEKEL